MEDFVVANLLFHAAAGTLLMLIGAGSALREMGSRRPVRVQGLALQGTPTVVELPATRAVRPVPQEAVEARSEAA